MVTYYRNPYNGRTAEVSSLWAFLGCFALGSIYFMYKGIWTHALFMIFIGIPLAIILPPVAFLFLFYPFAAPGILRARLRREGYVEVGGS